MGKGSVASADQTYDQTRLKLGKLSSNTSKKIRLIDKPNEKASYALEEELVKFHKLVLKKETNNKEDKKEGLTSEEVLKKLDQYIKSYQPYHWSQSSKDEKVNCLEQIFPCLIWLDEHKNELDSELQESISKLTKLFCRFPISKDPNHAWTVGETFYAQRVLWEMHSHWLKSSKETKNIRDRFEAFVLDECIQTGGTIPVICSEDLKSDLGKINTIKQGKFSQKEVEFLHCLQNKLLQALPLRDREQQSILVKPNDELLTYLNKHEKETIALIEKLKQEKTGGLCFNFDSQKKIFQFNKLTGQQSLEHYQVISDYLSDKKDKLSKKEKHILELLRLHLLSQVSDNISTAPSRKMIKKKSKFPLSNHKKKVGAALLAGIAGAYFFDFFDVFNNFFNLIVEIAQHSPSFGLILPCILIAVAATSIGVYYERHLSADELGLPSSQVSSHLKYLEERQDLILKEYYQLGEQLKSSKTPDQLKALTAWKMRLDTIKHSFDKEKKEVTAAATKLSSSRKFMQNTFLLLAAMPVIIASAFAGLNFGLNLVSWLGLAAFTIATVATAPVSSIIIVALMVSVAVITGVSVFVRERQNISNFVDKLFGLSHEKLEDLTHQSDKLNLANKTVDDKFIEAKSYCKKGKVPCTSMLPIQKGKKDYLLGWTHRSTKSEKPEIDPVVSQEELCSELSYSSMVAAC